MRTLAATILALFGATTALAQETKSYSGRVVDEDGKPVADAEISSLWQGGAEMRASEAVKTDAEGNFSGKVRWYKQALGLMAMDRERKLGGIAVLTEKTIDAPATIKLVPLVAVRAAFDSKGLGRKPESPTLTISALPRQARVAYWQSKTPDLTIKLPPGEYDLYVYAPDTERVHHKFALTLDKREVDLGTIDLAPTIIAQHYGKAPPAWNVTDARGVATDVKLADFKGKWVLVEFWGFW